MRTDEDRRIPVPSERNVVRSWLRLDADALAGAAIIARQISILIFGINGVWIFRIYLRTEAIATLRDKPISIGDAGDVLGSRRAAHRVVVLRTTVDVIK